MNLKQIGIAAILVMLGIFVWIFFCDPIVDAAQWTSKWMEGQMALKEVDKSDAAKTAEGTESKPAARVDVPKVIELLREAQKEQFERQQQLARQQHEHELALEAKKQECDALNQEDELVRLAVQAFAVPLGNPAACAQLEEALKKAGTPVEEPKEETPPSHPSSPADETPPAKEEKA